MLPLYEAKMIHHYDTKWATYEPDGSVRGVTPEEKRDPGFFVMPRYWVHESEVDRKLAGKWDKTWLLGWRDICRSTDARTVIAAQVPRVGYGDKWLVALPSRGRQEIQVIWSSFAFDFAARQKIGGTSLKYFTFMQLPMPAPGVLEAYAGWIADRVDRLNGQLSNDETSAQLRAELDAFSFRVYGIDRADVDYIMETFPIVKRKDVAAHGSYRTKELILAAYDSLAAEGGAANGVPS